MPVMALAVLMTRRFTWFGFMLQLRDRISAASPETRAAENDVPEPLKYDKPISDVGLLMSTVEPGDRVDTTDLPGARTSGLASPSVAVGPAPENGASVSSEMLSVVWSSDDPTVMTKGSSPGFETVP